MSNDRFVDPQRVAFDLFKTLPRDASIDMLNLVCFRALAAYPPGHPQHEATITGAEAYRSYSRESAPIFAGVGGTVIWSATPKLVLIGPPDEHWDAVFVARYPSASAFLEMVTDANYKKAVVHRQAAAETSRLIRTAPRQDPEPVFG